MANWTYVKAEVNFLAEYEQKFKDIFGKMIDPEGVSKKEWKYALEHPEEFLPMGTNGSLTYMCETYKQGKYVHATIRGNLEDYEGNLVDWFMNRIFILDTISPDGEFCDPSRNANVLRAVISVDSDTDEDKYKGLHVWDMGRVYDERWFHDEP